MYGFNYEGFKEVGNLDWHECAQRNETGDKMVTADHEQIRIKICENENERRSFIVISCRDSRP